MPKQIFVLDTARNQIGRKRPADPATFDFFEWILTKPKSFYADYTVHFIGSDGLDGFFKLSDVVSVSTHGQDRGTFGVCPAKEIRLHVNAVCTVDRMASTVQKR